VFTVRLLNFKHIIVDMQAQWVLYSV